MSRAELLRPWADAPLPPCHCNPPFSGEEYCTGACDGVHTRIPDPRFDALRGEHDWLQSPVIESPLTIEFCRWCLLARTLVDSEPYCLRTDLGALVRVAAACGFEILRDYVLDAVKDFYDRESYGGTYHDLEGVTTPEDAAAAALVAALPVRAS